VSAGAAPPPSLNIDALRRAMQRRMPGQPVGLVETHVSWVLLRGELAYKLKKPVRLGFLDFSTADARLRACEEEVRLNRRLAPGLYIDVVGVHGTPDAPAIDDPGPVVDHAVRMRRFPDGSLFSERLAAGVLSTSEIDRLARRIADFHLAAPVAAPTSSFGTPEVIESTTDQLLGALEAHVDPARIAPLRQWLESQARALRPTWSARRSAGCVRECHGDLHLANATVVDGEVVAFDCIEFDPALRWIDPMSDVAFMVMDLMAHGRRDLAFRFLDGWLERTGDHRGVAVLRHYMVYRALVRELVGTLRPRASDSGPDYLATARALAVAGSPRLMITHGTSGSGKTFVSQRLLEHEGAVRLRSDVERKRLFGLEALQPSASLRADDIYGPDATRRTFETLHERAAMALEAGYPTIVDAAFLLRWQRAMFEALAVRMKVPFAILSCHAPESVLHERIAQRQSGARDASEADAAVLQRQLQTREPLLDDELAQVIDVDTTAPVDVCAIGERWCHAAIADRPPAALG
jgi:aminoglycoside phosphotransferase family enzyme/predicted kinase